MTNDHDSPCANIWSSLLAGGSAHAKFEAVIKGLPPKLRGAKPANFPHSPWMLLEHMRLAQWDILEFSRNAKHVSPKWPEGYWPKNESPAERGRLDEERPAVSPRLEGDAESGRESQNGFVRAEFPGATDRRSCAKPCWLADHNAYHVAQLVDVRRMLGAWNE